MRAKIQLYGKTFLSNRKNFFSDVDYNAFVTGIKKVTDSNSSTNATKNIPKLHIHTNISGSAMNALFNKIYGNAKLKSEASRHIGKDEIVITFEKGEGGVRTGYHNNLEAKRVFGVIRTYSATNPKIGYDAFQNPIYLSEVYNNPNAPTNQVQAISEDSSFSSKPASRVGSLVKSPLNSLKDITEGAGAGNSADTGKQRKIIIIAAVVAVFLLFLFMKKR